MTFLGCSVLIICLGLPVLPGQTARAEEVQEEAQTDDPSDKFQLSGTTLVYDTESRAEIDEITNKDVDALRQLLRDNSEITTLQLNSSGGSVWAAREMARITIDFDLDTVVDGECSSSCVRILLAGQTRQMARGSKIGFHSRHWAPSAIEKYYDDWREDENWDSPFEFASWDLPRHLCRSL